MRELCAPVLSGQCYGLSGVILLAPGLWRMEGEKMRGGGRKERRGEGGRRRGGKREERGEGRKMSQFFSPPFIILFSFPGLTLRGWGGGNRGNLGTVGVSSPRWDIWTLFCKPVLMCTNVCYIMSAIMCICVCAGILTIM